MRLTLLYSFNLCWADVMAPSTDCLLTRFLMLEAVPNSSPSIFWARDTCAAIKPQCKSVIVFEKSLSSRLLELSSKLLTICSSAVTGLT